MNIDEFVVDNLFNTVETEDGMVYWRECVEDLEGYIILWEDGSHHHTYHNPENLFGE